MTAAPGEALLTVDDVARRLSVAPKTVHAWAASGRIPSVRLGVGPRAPRRFERAAIERWLRAQSEGVAS